MKGLLATLITVSGVVLITTSSRAQETNSPSSSKLLSPIQSRECSGYLSSCLPGTGGLESSPIEERVKYTQEEINYGMNGEGKGDKLEGSTMQLNPEQKAELNNSSSPGSAVLIRF